MVQPPHSCVTQDGKHSLRIVYCCVFNGLILVDCCFEAAMSIGGGRVGCIFCSKIVIIGVEFHEVRESFFSVEVEGDWGLYIERGRGFCGRQIWALWIFENEIVFGEERRIVDQGFVEKFLPIFSVKWSIPDAHSPWFMVGLYLWSIGAWYCKLWFTTL